MSKPEGTDNPQKPKYELGQELFSFDRNHSEVLMGTVREIQLEEGPDTPEHLYLLEECIYLIRECDLSATLGDAWRVGAAYIDGELYAETERAKDNFDRRFVTLNSSTEAL